jgi:hypothetical protein
MNDIKFFERLHWSDAVWDAPNGNQISYQIADVTDWFHSLIGDPYIAVLGKWRKSYSLVIKHGEDILVGYKQIPKEDFEKQPERYIHYFDEQLVTAIPHRASNIGALERMLDRDRFAARHNLDEYDDEYDGRYW